MGQQAYRRIGAATGFFNLGDSGGPWFTGSQATGIFMGWCIFDGLAHLTFSKADRLDEAINVRVMTN